MVQHIRTQLNSLKQQIAGGDTLEALEELQNLSVSITKLYNEVLLQRSRYIRVERDERQGIITRETAGVENNRINDAVLYLVNQLATRLTPVPAPPATTKRTVSLPASIPTEKIVGINNLERISWAKCAQVLAPHYAGSKLPRSILIPVSGGHAPRNFHVSQGGMNNVGC